MKKNNIQEKENLNKDRRYTGKSQGCCTRAPRHGFLVSAVCFLIDLTNAVRCENCGQEIPPSESHYNEDLWEGALCDGCADEMSREWYGEAYVGSFMDDDS